MALPAGTPVPSARSSSDRTTYVRWHIVALLFVVSFVAYVLRTNMSVAVEQMKVDLELTPMQVGWVLGAFAWGYAIFQFPGGVFGDRLGGRRALTLIALAWGGLTLLVGLLPQRGAVSIAAILGSLTVLRFLMGATQAPLFPITGNVFYHWFPASSWALPNGLTNAGLTLGAAATGPLITWLAVTLGWRQSFLLTAPLAFLIAAAWWWYARDRPGEHARVSAKEVALIEADRPAAQASAGWAGWRSVLRNRNVVLLAASYFCSNFVFYFFFNWLFIYLVEVRGFKALEGGFYSMAPWGMGAIGAAAGGWLGDRLAIRMGPREGYRVPVVLALVAVAGLIFAAATARDAVIAVVLLSLCLGLQQLTEGPYWAATIAVSDRDAATGCGVLNTGGNLVGGIGAPMVAFIADRFGWVAVLGTASVFALVAAALWIWIRADEQFHA